MDNTKGQKLYSPCCKMSEALAYSCLNVQLFKYLKSTFKYLLDSKAQVCGEIRKQKNERIIL